MEQEIWKDVIGYEGLYQVSNLGRVKSLFRLMEYPNYNKVLNERILKNLINSKGYYCTILYKNKKAKTFLVHRMVAIAFIPNPYNKPQINHKDGNKLNLSLSNLEWASCRDNILHAYNIGLNYVSDKQRMILAERNKTTINKSARKVIDSKTGIIYPSIAHAARELKMQKNTLRIFLIGKYPNKTTMQLL